MECHRRLYVALIIAGALGAPSSALASDESAELTKLLDAQVKAIAAGDAKAFAATFADDAFLILPTAADDAIGAPAIEAAAKHWLDTGGKAAVKLEQLHVPKQQSAGAGTWCDAVLVGATTRWRFTGVIFQTHTDQGEGPFKFGAVHLSEAVDDKTALAAAADGKLPKLASLKGESSRSPDGDPSKIASFAKHVHRNASVSLIGSAPTEHTVGAAAVAKQLVGWKSLKLTTQSVFTGSDPGAMWGFEWVIAHVEATFTVKGKTVKVPYRALLILSTPSAPGADHGASVELLSAHFSVATR